MNRLTKFFEELRELPRHLQEFCERFLMQRSGFEAARIPAKALPCAAPAGAGVLRLP